MKRLLISMTILTFLFVPQFALGSDVDDLKAAFEKMVNAYISLDAETLASLLHPGCVYYNTVAAFPDVTPMNISQKDLIRIINDSFDKVEHFSMTPFARTVTSGFRTILRKSRVIPSVSTRFPLKESARV